jgi:serine phosphatase RsbU (regulator of sigma subunit)
MRGGAGLVVSETDETRIGSLGRDAPGLVDARVHYLQVTDGLEVGRRFVIGQGGIVVGRTPPAGIVLLDSEVSRSQCRIDLAGDQLLVTDLGSTNGTYVDGVRIQQPTAMPVGATLQVGRQTLKHDSRSSLDLAQRQELDRDLERANAYVQALLPPPVREGPVRVDWVYLPSAKLGGDAFGYGPLADNVFAGYLVDVSGHGAAAAMHAATLLNVLRRRALPDTDMRDPAQVLRALNAMFPMDSCADMYFTIWYGVYDVARRRLAYASGGHHAAFLVPPQRDRATELRTKNPLIGAMPGLSYVSAEIDITPGSALYVFSDGVFEITTRAGVQWQLSDFTPLLLAPAKPDVPEPQRLFEAVQATAQPGGFDDDFSMVAFTFE